MRSLRSEGLRFLRRGPVAVWPVVLEAGTAKPISVRHDVWCDGAVRLGNHSPVRRRGTLKMPRHAALGRTTVVPGRRVRCRAAYGDGRRGQSDCYLAKHDANQTRRPVLGLPSSVGKPLRVCTAGRLYVFSGGATLDSSRERRLHAARRCRPRRAYHPTELLDLGHLGTPPVRAALAVIMAIMAITASLSTVTAYTGPTAREGCPAQRTEATAVPCKARLGLLDIRYGVAAEPESIVSAGVTGRLSLCRAKIPGHCAGQQSEHHNCCKPTTSGWNIFHLTQSSQPSCDPPPSTLSPGLVPSLLP
jgi:hypothetical protein